jgi:hypothetical protein
VVRGVVVRAGWARRAGGGRSGLPAGKRQKPFGFSLTFLGLNGWAGLRGTSACRRPHPMRHAFAALLALLALVPACEADPGVGESGTIEGPRGERCDEMQLCGRTECSAEITAVRDCNLDDLGCGADDVRWSASQSALASCLDAASCNMTSCDLTAAFTDRDENTSEYCDSDSDAELLDLARLSMFSTDAVAECKALE